MEKNIVHISSDLEPLIPRYLDNRRADIVILREAVHSSNSETIRSIGHTMKGSGASYGLEEVSTFGRMLEEAAQVSDLSRVEATINQIAHFLETLDIIFVDDMP